MEQPADAGCFFTPTIIPNSKDRYKKKIQWRRELLETATQFSEFLDILAVGIGKLRAGLYKVNKHGNRVDKKIRHLNDWPHSHY